MLKENLGQPQIKIQRARQIKATVGNISKRLDNGLLIPELEPTTRHHALQIHVVITTSFNVMSRTSYLQESPHMLSRL